MSKSLPKLDSKLQQYIDPIIADAIQDPYLYIEPGDFASMLVGELEETGVVDTSTSQLETTIEEYIRLKVS